VVVCGSYRRGALESSDVDVLVAPPPGKRELPEGFLQKVLDRLGAPPGGTGLLVDHLSGHLGGKAASYNGICRLEPTLPCRRLDIKVFPRDTFAFALCYFTGPAQFTRSLRLQALHLGYVVQCAPRSSCSLSPSRCACVSRVRVSMQVQARREGDLPDGA